MFFSVITKILNWELSLRIELLFKDGMGVKDKKCLYHGGSLKNPIFKGRFTKNQYLGGIT